MNDTPQSREGYLKITEIFHSLQGEALQAGLPTVFVRLTGCPLRCTYCDSEYAFYGGEWKHYDDTVYGGDFLQHQPPVKEMADWAPRIINLMDRLGVPFNRTAEGFRDQRRFGGTLYKRTAFAGATTGQQLLYALDEQVRRWEVEGKVTKYEGWDFLAPVLDGNGQCRGAMRDGRVHSIEEGLIEQVEEITDIPVEHIESAGGTVDPVPVGASEGAN